MVVQRVVDGDTVHLVDPVAGGVVKVRILGIDTPETVDPRKGVGCWGPEASQWAKSLLTNQRVTVRGDPTQDARDKYGRALLYLTLSDGSDYSLTAVRLGYAKYYLYRVPVSEASELQAAETEARVAGRGLWGPPCLGTTDAKPSSYSPPGALADRDEPRSVTVGWESPSPAPVSFLGVRPATSRVRS